MSTLTDIAAVVREANRLAEQGGTEQERAQFEERKQAVLAELQEAAD